MHTSPEVLALLALGEQDADSADRRHLDSCPQCRDELATLSRLIDNGPVSADGHGEVLDAPSEAVWASIQAELGFIPVTRDWPSPPGPPQPELTVPQPAQASGAPSAASSARPAAPGAAEPQVPDRSQNRPQILLGVLLIVVALLLLGLGIFGLA